MLQNLKIRSQLAVGFASVILIIVLILLINLNEINKISNLAGKIVTLRVPTAENSALIKSGIHAALGALRGWMLIGEEKFRKEREHIWKEEIYLALAQMQKLSQNWTNPENVIRLREIENLIEDFARFQKEIEDIAQSPDNIPAHKILFEQAIPKAEIMTEMITKMIDLESIEHNISNNHFLLVIMADVRGSLGLVLADIRAFLISGEEKFKTNYEKNWSKNTKRYNDLKKYQNLLTEKQMMAFKNFTAARKEFTPLPPIMIDLRSKEDWNLANFWLATKAAPIGAKLSVILDAMASNQQELLRNDDKRIKNFIQDLIDLEWLLLAVGSLVALGFSIFITRGITRPISQLVDLAKKIATGNFKPDLPTTTTTTTTTTTETTQLKIAMEKMGQDIFNMLQKTRESEAKIRSILDTAVDGIITITNMGIIKSFNPAAEKIFGYTGEEVFEKNISILMPEPDRSKHNGYIIHYLETGQTKIIGKGREVVGLRKNGEQFPLHLSVSKVESSDEILFAGILRDLTEQKIIQNQLLQSSKLVQSSKLASVGELAAGVAHELNQPISYIRGLAQVAIRRGQKRLNMVFLFDTLKDVVEGTDRMMAIINHLRDFSRESTATTISQIDLEEILKKSFLLLNVQFKNRGIEVEKRLEESLPAISGNANQLEQVFINMLTNARDALEGVESPKILIVIKQNKPNILISFSDNGKGIPQQIQEKIFDPFFTTKDIGKGTGLGMSISYGIIQEHKGTISMTSKEGKGTTFRIALPVSLEEVE